MKTKAAIALAVLAAVFVSVRATGAGALRSLASQFPAQQINGQTYRCGLPWLPAGVRTGLGVDSPVQLDGTTPATANSEACLPTAAAIEYVLAADVAAEVAKSGAWSGLATGSDCKAMIVAVEWSGVANGEVARGPHPEAIQVCGPTPTYNRIDQLDGVPGQSVRIIEVVSTYTLASQPAIRRITRQADGTWPAAVLNRLRCACRQRPAGVCNVTVDGGTAPGAFGAQFEPGAWSGAGCIRKPCGEALEVVDTEGADYSMPQGCR